MHAPTDAFLSSSRSGNGVWQCGLRTQLTPTFGYMTRQFEGLTIGDSVD